MKPIIEINATETKPGEWFLQFTGKKYAGKLTFAEVEYRAFLNAISTGVLATGGLELKITEIVF